jgi:raffinose/stachyose/melibiose transport system substrate-binding protein
MRSGTSHPQLRAAAASTAIMAGAAMAAGLAQAQDRTELEVWSWQVDNADDYEVVFALYEAAHPEIDVIFRAFPDTDYPTVLRSGLSGEQGPDLVFLHPYGSVAPYSRAGQLVPITPETVPELANFAPESVAAAEVDGQIWGIPFAQVFLQIFYDKALFESLGVVPPATPADVAPFLETIEAAGVTPFAVSGIAGAMPVFYFDILVGNTYGGRKFLEAAVAGEQSFAAKPMVEAFALYDSYEKYFPRFVSGVSVDDANSLFVSGEAAMYPNGSWMLDFLRTEMPDADLGVFTFPADDSGGPPPVFGYEDGSIALSANSDNPEEALELLRWMGTPEFGQAYTDELSQVSSVVGVEPTDPLLAEMLANYQANPVPVVWVTEYFGTSAPAPFTTLAVLVSNLLVDATDPAAAAAQLEADAREFEQMSP